MARFCHGFVLAETGLFCRHLCAASRFSDPRSAFRRKGMFMSIIDVQNLTFGYDGAAENVFENVSFRLDTDWKLGFTGRNGRGKTTFLRLLMGEFGYPGGFRPRSGSSISPIRFTIPTGFHMTPRARSTMALRTGSLNASFHFSRSTRRSYGGRIRRSRWASGRSFYSP